MRRLVLTLWLGVLLAFPAVAQQNHALLIGVSSYSNLDERHWLLGPANDVDLVREFLTSNASLGFAKGNVTVLADGVEGAAAEPTLSGIRDQMAALADRVEPGDFVYLHFSGHGSQAPAQDPDSELDGLDELFLPLDIGPWDDSVGQVENALIDDEIGQMIGAIRARGATVWAVFDSCHSGTVTRALGDGSDDVRLRRMDRGALGIPDPETVLRSGTSGDGASDDIAGAEGGGFVAFFAAQTNETTPEKRLPQGKPGRRSQGVFTFTLFEALAANPGVTYRQLAQDVLRRYGVGNLARSTPLFEGDLDLPVFASEGTAPVRQWPVQPGEGAVTIPAGHLHGLDAGMRLAVLASPADADAAAIGVVEASEVGTFQASLVAVEPKTLFETLPKNAYVRLTEGRVDFGLRLAMPEGEGPLVEQVQSAIDMARALDLIGPRIRIVDPAAPADLRLAILPESDEPNAVWFLPSSGILEQSGLRRSPAIGLQGRSDAELAELIADTVRRIARVQNLLKLGSAFALDALEVDLQLRTRSPDNPRLRDLETVPVPVLVPDDEVHVVIRNQEAFPVDLNVLYIGSDFSISHMFAGRLHPGDRLKQGLLRITDTAFGRDRVVILLSPAKAQSAVEDLAFLAQEELAVTRGTGSDFAAVLAQAGFGAQTRSATRLGGDEAAGPGPAMLVFDLDTAKRRGSD